MRTMIVPLLPAVEQQLQQLDVTRAQIARRFIRRLRLEPELGYRLQRGRLNSERCRAVRFDVDSDPDDLFGNRPAPRRRGDQDLGEGPRWRIVYWTRETTDRRLRVIIVLAVGIGHPKPGQPSVFDDATRLLDELIKETT